MKQGLAAVDWMGSLSVIATTLMIMLALEFGGVVMPWSSPTVICLIVFGVVSAFIFAAVEWKVAKYPIVPMRLFAVRSNVASLGVSSFQGFVFISGSYYLPLYFQAVLGASPLMSGLYILPYVLSLSVVSAISGALIKKTGKYVPVIVTGMALMTLGYGLFTNLEPRANWPKIVLYQLIAGSGVGPNFQGPLIALQTMVQPRDMASATATYSFTRQLSTAVSIVIGGVVFQNCMQQQYPRLVEELGPDTAKLFSGANAASSVGLVADLPADDRSIVRLAFYDSLRTMYIMYTAFSGVGLILSFFIGHRVLSKQHEEYKTGLDSLRAAREMDKSLKLSRDEEHANPPANGEGSGEKQRRRSRFLKRPAFFFE